MLNAADQFAAGFGNAVTFGATTKFRESNYGDIATQNHSGGLFNAGQVAGVAASTAVGFGAAGNAARGGGWAIRAAQAYTTVGDAVGAYQSAKNFLEGCFTPTDLLGFAPVVGYVGGHLARKAQFLGTCFVAGTKVLTPKGEKAIETIALGDTVISADPESGKIANHQVMHQFQSSVPVVLDIQIGDVTITCSPEHPFWVYDL